MRQRNRNSVFVLVLISLLLSLKVYMLELDGKDVLNESCPCFCVFGADFEQIYIAEIEILCVKSLVFYASIDVKFYDLYVSVRLFCHSRENFVFDSRLRALYKKKLL